MAENGINLAEVGEKKDEKMVKKAVKTKHALMGDERDVKTTKITQKVAENGCFSLKNGRKMAENGRKMSETDQNDQK
jgi:hypothetical protein